MEGVAEPQPIRDEAGIGEHRRFDFEILEIGVADDVEEGRVNRDDGLEADPPVDEEARRRRTQKSVLERKAPPTFDVIVEIQDRERVVVHSDVADTVDAMLRVVGVDRLLYGSDRPVVDPVGVAALGAAAEHAITTTNPERFV